MLCLICVTGSNILACQIFIGFDISPLHRPFPIDFGIGIELLSGYLTVDSLTATFSFLHNMLTANEKSSIMRLGCLSIIDNAQQAAGLQENEVELAKLKVHESHVKKQIADTEANTISLRKKISDISLQVDRLRADAVEGMSHLAPYYRAQPTLEGPHRRRRKSRPTGVGRGRYVRGPAAFYHVSPF